MAQGCSFGPAAVRLLFVAIVVSVLAVGGASAQILDYGKLVGGADPSSAQSAPRQSTPLQSTPLQSTPIQTRPIIGATPTAADYGLIAESVPECTV